MKLEVVKYYIFYSHEPFKLKTGLGNYFLIVIVTLIYFLNSWREPLPIYSMILPIWFLILTSWSAFLIISKRIYALKTVKLQVVHGAAWFTFLTSTLLLTLFEIFLSGGFNMLLYIMVLLIILCVGACTAIKFDRALRRNSESNEECEISEPNSKVAFAGTVFGSAGIFGASVGRSLSENASDLERYIVICVVLSGLSAVCAFATGFKLHKTYIILRYCPDIDKYYHPSLIKK